MNSWIVNMVIAFALWLSTFSPSERVALGSAFLVLVGVIGEEVAEIENLRDEKKPN
jgi:hypothetical protein